MTDSIKQIMDFTRFLLVAMDQMFTERILQETASPSMAAMIKSECIPYEYPIKISDTLDLKTAVNKIWKADTVHTFIWIRIVLSFCPFIGLE